MENIPTAAEKRREYETVANAKAQEELAMIADKIKNASGVYIYLSRKPSDNVEAFLKKKGYTCGFVQTGINESEYKISW